MVELLTIRELRKTFRRSGGLFGQDSRGTRFTAVDGVSFDMARGETFAIVGEGGCGKTTPRACSCALSSPTAARFNSRIATFLHFAAGNCAPSAAACKVVFQDPFASLNPR